MLPLESLSVPVKTDITSEKAVITSEKAVISRKRLDELEYIEKNLQAIIQAAVEKSCPDCKNKTCSANK